MQARFYLPMYHRFGSPDPARDQHFEDTQSWNIYSYCGNSPVMRIDANGMEWGWFDQALDAVANTAAAVHVGIQSIPILDTAYAGGARLGEAISGSRVNYESRESGPSVQGLSLEERSQSAAQGAQTVGLLCVAGTIPGSSTIPTGSTLSSSGALVQSGVVVNNGSLAGVAAMAAHGGGRNGQHANQDRKESAKAKHETAKEKYDRLKAKTNKTPEDKKALQDAQREMEHLKRKADATGENHSQKAKT
jgi:hypothetical protein